MTTLDQTNAMLSALADPIRFRMMDLIHRNCELCVCELTRALDIPQPKASKHLAVLRESGLLRMRRDAQWVLYAVNPEIAPKLLEGVEAILAGSADAPELVADRERLEISPGRTPRCRAA